MGFDAATISAADAKTGIGKTGVELRYHIKKELWALPEEQRGEVADYNATKEGGKFKAMGLKSFNTKKKQGTSVDSQVTSEKKLKSWVSSSVAKAIKTQVIGKTEAKENLVKSLVSLISSITGSKGGATIGSESKYGVTDAIMEQAKVAAGQLQAINKGGSHHGKYYKKPCSDAGEIYKYKPPSPNHHVIKHIQVAPTGGGARERSAGTTELDSYANMVVIGAQGKIIQQTGRFADVNALSSDVGTMSRNPLFMQRLHMIAHSLDEKS